MTEPSSSRISPPPLKRQRITKEISRSPKRSLKVTDAKQAAIADSRLRTSAASLRIYSWNVNGIGPLLPPETPAITNFFKSSGNSSIRSEPRSTPPTLREYLRQWGWPDVVGLQEVKIAPSDTKTQSLVRRAVNAQSGRDNDNGDGPIYDAHFCLPRDKHNATGFGGKVYGVCTIIRRDLDADVVIKTVDWDLEGRVLISELPNLQVAIINIYAVNGTDNDYRDPLTGKVIGTRHDRKRDFHSHLASEVQAYQAHPKNYEVIIAGDMNISRTEIDSFPHLRTAESHVLNRADFEEKFIVNLGMLDSFRHLHGDEKRKYTYRPRNKPWGSGGDRVDLILLTEGLQGCLTEAHILDTELARGSSDHVPLYVELSFGSGER